jgi:hypothetical protein
MVNVGRRLTDHPVGGNWFHSSPAWERLVRPLIEKAAFAVHSG